MPKTEAFISGSGKVLGIIALPSDEEFQNRIDYSRLPLSYVMHWPDEWIRNPIVKGIDYVMDL